MASSGTGSALAGRRVLVVEDEVLLAMDVDILLRELGCIVIGPVATADRALDLLTSERPDAALLDLNLNGRPALPVAVALKALGVPFVVLSGYSPGQTEAPELSCVPRLEKPVRHQELLRALAEVLTPAPPG